MTAAPAFAQQVQNVAVEYKLQTEDLGSLVLKEKRTVTLQLVNSYTTKLNKKYPVIYRLNGQGNLPLINTVVERLQEANTSPEVIVVAMENTDRLRELCPSVNQEPQGPVGMDGGDSIQS